VALVAVCDLDVDKAFKRAEQYNVDKVATNYDFDEPQPSSFGTGVFYSGADSSQLS
jgi:hypothetical protein